MVGLSAHGARALPAAAVADSRDEDAAMRMSKLLIPTLKEDPADAEVVSHRLMLRAGMIRKLTSGVYSYLPLGYRSLRKVEQIVGEEMDAAGAQEVFLPMVQPSELWI